MLAVTVTTPPLVKPTPVIFGNTSIDGRKNPWWKKIDKSTQHMHETSKKTNIKAHNTCMKQVKKKQNKTSKQKKELLVDDFSRPMTTGSRFPN